MNFWRLVLIEFFNFEWLCCNANTWCSEYSAHFLCLNAHSFTEGVQFLQVGDFESEIEILKVRMAKTAVDVMKPFLQFSLQFVADQAHNMLSLMLDPRFKGLEYVIDYVGVAKAKQVVEEYDKKIDSLPCQGAQVPEPWWVPNHNSWSCSVKYSIWCSSVCWRSLRGHSHCWVVTFPAPHYSASRSGGASDVMHRASLQFLFLHVRFWLF